MQLKTSLFSKSLWLQNSKSVTWLGILYTFVLLLTFPVILLTIVTNEFSVTGAQDAKMYMQQSFPILFVYMLVAPLIFSSVLFRYLHKPLASNFLHSLPFKRDTHYITNFISGLVGLSVPIIITAAAIISVREMYGVTEAFTIKEILLWMITVIFGQMLLFSLSTFIQITTGLMLVHVTLYFIFVFYPFTISLLGVTVLSNSFLGYSASFFYNRIIEEFIFILTFSRSFSVPLTGNEWGIFSAVFFVLFLFSWLAYRKRPMESATQAISFTILKPVYVYAVTFLFTLAFGAFFFSVGGGSNAWGIFGYIAGSLLGFTITQMVLQKSWRIAKSYKQYGIFAVVLTLFISVVELDLTRYESRVPEVNDVEKVWISNSEWVLHDYEQKDDLARKIQTVVNSFGFGTQYYTTERNKQAIIELHQHAVDHPELQQQYSEDRQSIFIAYKLKNGSTQYRTYLVPNKLLNKVLQPVLQSDETLKLVNVIEDIQQSNDYRIGTVTFRDARGNSKEMQYSDQVQLFLNALKEDNKNGVAPILLDSSSYPSNYSAEFVIENSSTGGTEFIYYDVPNTSENGIKAIKTILSSTNK